MKKDYKRLKKALLAAYAAALLAYLLVCGISFVKASGRAGQSQTLRLEDFTLQSIIQRPDEAGLQCFVSTDADPHLVYRAAAQGQAEYPVFYPGRLTFAAVPHKPGGEIVVYYTTTQGDAAAQNFSERNKLWARQANDGSWYFDFGSRGVTSLRIDPDTVQEGILWQVERIVLSDLRPAASYFVPSPLVLGVLLLLPGFLVAVCAEIGRIIGQGKKAQGTARAMPWEQEGEGG